ncbi:ATP-binding protein [Kitasatospora sp. NPDC087314]
MRDHVLAGRSFASTDRLLHRCTTLPINGQSYRLRSQLSTLEGALAGI